MHNESIIQKRLIELSDRSQAILNATSSVVTNARTGKTSQKVSVADAKGWATSVLSLFVQSFGETSVHYKQFHEVLSKFDGWQSSFKQLIAVFNSGKEDYEGGYIFNLRGLIRAEVLSDALEQAEELLKSGYKDAACVLAGVSLEIVVKDLAARRSISLAKLDKMNADLSKAGAYNSAKQKQITAWADLRIKSAHGQWNDYNAADVQEMLSGVQRFIADNL